MPSSPSATIRQLTPADVPLLRSMTAVLGRAFGEPEEYTADPGFEPLHTVLRALGLGG